VFLTFFTTPVAVTTTLQPLSKAPGIIPCFPQITPLVLTFPPLNQTQKGIASIFQAIQSSLGESTFMMAYLPSLLLLVITILLPLLIWGSLLPPKLPYLSKQKLTKHNSVFNRWRASHPLSYTQVPRDEDVHVSPLQFFDPAQRTHDEHRCPRWGQLDQSVCILSSFLVKHKF